MHILPIEDCMVIQKPTIKIAKLFLWGCVIVISHSSMVLARLDIKRSHIRLSAPSYYKESGHETYRATAPRGGVIKVEKNHYYLLNPQTAVGSNSNFASPGVPAQIMRVPASESFSVQGGSGSMERSYTNEGYSVPPVTIHMGR